MPIHDVGYRPWNGQRVSPTMRWWMISESGIRMAIRAPWVRRIIFFCWLPILYWGTGIFVFENQGLANAELLETPNSIEIVDVEMGDSITLEIDGEQKKIPFNFDEAEFNPETLKAIADGIERKQTAMAIRNTFSGFPAIDKLSDALSSGDSEKMRSVFWSWLLMTYFRYPQSTAMIFLLGFITPVLISRDIRSRAMLIYFSRPIGRLEYLFGKFMIPTLFLTFITMLPALSLYALGVALSPDISVVVATWHIPLRIALATLCVVLPTVSLSLMLSSLTQESRFAAFAWFAVWALGQGLGLRCSYRHRLAQE
ncbi:MAG: ABC transporter permease subunit [Pirellulaceae bacterium]